MALKTTVTETNDVEKPDGECAPCASPCSADLSFGVGPPSTRENAIEIAADLVREVDCEHRPLACEAARKLKQLHDDNRRQSLEIANLTGRLEERRQGSRKPCAIAWAKPAIPRG